MLCLFVSFGPCRPSSLDACQCLQFFFLCSAHGEEEVMDNESTLVLLLHPPIVHWRWTALFFSAASAIVFSLPSLVFVFPPIFLFFFLLLLLLFVFCHLLLMKAIFRMSEYSFFLVLVWAFFWFLTLYYIVPNSVRWWKTKEKCSQRQNLREKDDAQYFAGFLLVGHCSRTGYVGRWRRNDGTWSTRSRCRCAACAADFTSTTRRRRRIIGRSFDYADGLVGAAAAIVV